MAKLHPTPITSSQAWKMLNTAINDPNYSVDQEKNIDGLGKWIKGINLNAYRNENNPPYTPSPNNGRDWQAASDDFRRQKKIFKYKLPNGRVFFVLPEFCADFEELYPEADLT